MSTTPGHETLIGQLRGWAATKADAAAVFGKGPEGWSSLTWAQYWAQTQAVGRALVGWGHEVGECVAIVGDNRTPWVIAEFGVMAARGIVAPIYQTNTAEQVAYLLGHSQAKIAFADLPEQIDKLLACSDEGAVKLERVVSMLDDEHPDPRVTRWSDFLAMGAEHADAEATAELDRRVEAIEAKDVALLIYTSGTTGVPKAVQMDHDNMCAVSAGAIERYPHIDGENFKIISYLPLSHIAEQMFTNMVHLRTGGEVWFCDDIKAIRDYLAEVRPTVFVGVPRVWEKMQAAMQARLAAAPFHRRALAQWAMAHELRAFRHYCATGEELGGLGLKVARRLVIDKIRVGLGFDKLIIAASGAAPISAGTIDFLASAGVVIHEGFGMSETAGAVTAPPYRRPRVGSVGKAFAGVEVKIAEDGEICLRGRPMTRGYMGMPEQTAELIDDEGWLHTGDLGRLDEDGFLAITGRKKDLLITAGGKNVAPSKIEGLLGQLRGIGQAVVVGDSQPYLCALLVLDPEAREETCARLGLPASTDLAELAGEVGLRKEIQRALDEDINPQLARYETIKKFVVLPREFSVEGGELTPTMKVKRNVVQTRYAAEIAALYAGVSAPE